MLSPGHADKWRLDDKVEWNVKLLQLAPDTVAGPVLHLLSLRGPAMNPLAIGAQIMVQRQDSRLLRIIGATDTSANSQAFLSVPVTMSDNEAVSLQILWPGGCHSAAEIGAMRDRNITIDYPESCAANAPVDADAGAQETSRP
jgi:hypothetical protein